MTAGDKRRSLRVACNRSVFAPGEGAQHFAETQRLFSKPAIVVEEPDGFTFSFATSERGALEQWISEERRCCPFLELELQDDTDALRLRISGPDGTKELLRAAARAATTETEP